jgi:hypothetical protein
MPLMTAIDTYVTSSCYLYESTTDSYVTKSVVKSRIDEVEESAKYPFIAGRQTNRRAHENMTERRLGNTSK